MEVMNVSLMHRYENGKRRGYGNETKLLSCVFFCSGITQKIFFPFVFLRDRRSDATVQHNRLSNPSHPTYSRTSPVWDIYVLLLAFPGALNSD